MRLTLTPVVVVMLAAAGSSEAQTSPPAASPSLFGEASKVSPDAPSSPHSVAMPTRGSGTGNAGAAHLREIGARPVPLAPAVAVHDQPLAAAIRALVPVGFDLRIGSGVPELQRVSWAAGESWLARLTAVLQSSSLRAVVAWDAREVLVQVIPRADPNQVRPWSILVGDQTVRRGLARWLDAAGLALSWEAPGPVPVRADWTREGTLDEALESLALDLSSTEQPLCIRRYQNGVVRVTTTDRCPADLVGRESLRPLGPSTGDATKDGPSAFPAPARGAPAAAPAPALNSLNSDRGT
jgi:hypothetical protein